MTHPTGLPTVGAPAAARAMLAERDRWSGAVEVLDAALEAFAERGLEARFVVVWTPTGRPNGAGTQVIAAGLDAMATAGLTATGVWTAWFVHAPPARHRG